MDREEGKMDVKRKSKPMDMLFDCEDDEPIGTLLKLKGKRKSKKIKLDVNGDLNEVKGLQTHPAQEDELGCMEDTLQSFRKKLRGPRKDSGSGVDKGEDFSTESAKDRDLDPDIMPGVQKNCLGSSEGGSTVNANMEGFKSKTKMKSKRSKSNLNASISGSKSEFDSSSCYHGSENDILQHENEKASELREEILEDPLSSFLQKAQSGLVRKSQNSSRSKQGKETQVSEQGSIPDSAVSSEAPANNNPCSVSKLVNKSIELDDSVHTDPIQSSKPTLVCQMVGDCLECTDSEQGLKTNQLEGSSINLHDSSFKDITGNSLSKSLVQKSPSSIRACSSKIDEVLNEEIYFDGPADQQGFTNADTGSSNILDRSCGVFQCATTNDSCPLPSKEPTNCAKENIGIHLDPHTNVTKHVNDSEKVIDNSADVLEHSLVSKEGACSPNSDYPSGKEDANDISLGDRRSQDDPETKEANISVAQRTVRNTKRCRHGDMAYEGDADWEVLMQGQEFFVSHLDIDKSREREKFSSIAVDAESGKAAAVSAGLRARAVGPIEKIKFKEVLKRKGGLQEYLECRNYILSVWNKDMSRVLPISDFGVSESPRASLIKDIYTFLDQYGYINFGVPTEKYNSGNSVKRDLKLLTEKFGENSSHPSTDTEDGVSFIFGKEKSSETYIKEKNDDALDEKQAGDCKAEDGVNLQVLESSFPTVPEGCSYDDSQLISSLDPVPLKDVVGSKSLDSLPSYKDENEKMLTAVPPNIPPPGAVVPSLPSKIPNASTAVLSTTTYYESSLTQCQSEPTKNIIVVGAGPAGLIAARHLQRQGFSVIVLEARSRTGGRVFTDRSSLSVPVDLGASIITGVEADVATERRPDPSSLICSQLGLELTVLNSDCPLYDTVTGHKVPADLDQELEAEYNSLLDDMELLVAEKGERAMKMSLEEGLEYALETRRSEIDDMGTERVSSPNTSITGKSFALDSGTHNSKTEGLSPLERRVMDWHFAHLEYGCAALLKEVSLPNWNQDDEYGGFGGAHCMIKGGYSTVVESLAEGICIHLDHVVTDITYFPKDCGTTNSMHKKVKVSTSNGKEFTGDAVLVTVPLGCLKAETIKFSPSLPQWKYLSIKRLGFGILNKVVLEFSEVFWDDSVDYFGATAEDADQRGWCFMFWNVRKTVGAPVLIALVVGKAAIDGQDMSSSVHVSHALAVLRKLFGEETVSDPVASVVTDWGRDPYCYGAYSYVAVGSSGEDYDLLGRPVDNCVFFAGEATCKEHPDTVGGAMMSGLREAVRISDILNSGTDYTAEVEAMEAAKRQSNIQRSEMKDIIQRLEAVDFSSLVYRNSLDRSKISSWGAMLKEMFFTAKTTAGRLHLAKKLLDLPVGFLKTFASTREGLSTLNIWILDAMGKDGTQLLRHCVRLLVLVSNDLLAVRLSGVGKTVKEKVCVHASRDIRAIASQLVNVWVELFRKEKAAKGGHKLPRHSSALDSKSKSSFVYGKPPLRTNHIEPESKGSSKVSMSAGLQFSSGTSTKRVIDKPGELVTKINTRTDVQILNSQGSTGCRDVIDANHEIPMSEEEKAAMVAAEAARAAAIAAAKAYASFGTMHNTMAKLPKILSFQKFAMHDQYAHLDDSDGRKNWSGAAVGRQDCFSEIDSRNCRVRDWSVDFSAAGVNVENSKMSVDNHSQRSHSNEVANQLNFIEHSGETLAVDNSILTKAWVDSSGSIGLKDYNAIERWQCQAAAASSGFSHRSMHITDEEDSNMNSNLDNRKYDVLENERSASQVTINKASRGNHQKGGEHIKQSVVEYVASLLMPLYKAKKIDKDGYKSIMKKTATKVMEKTTDAEKKMAVSEFLDSKRKNKIRAFVDTLIDRHMSTKPDGKSGSTEKD